MPVYDFRCINVECRAIFEMDAKMSEFRDLRPACPKCKSECQYEFTPTIVQVAFKDGPSGSWPSKGDRFKKYRDEQTKKASKRQRDRYGEGTRLIPNYNGQQTESWREAKSLALSDKDNDNRLESAATFNNHIEKENSKKILV